MKIADALASVTRLFIDTSPVIFHIEGSLKHQPVTDLVFQWIEDGAMQAVTSSITLAECLVHPFRHGNSALAMEFRDVIKSAPHTHFVGIDSVAERAAEFRARYNLTLTDAFQVAAALQEGCEAFLTNDVAIKRVHESCRTGNDLSVLILDDLEL